jgi:hypothetical protein
VFQTDNELFPTIFENTVSVLEDIHRVCQAHDIDLTVVLIPAEVQVDRALQRRLIARNPAFRADNTDFELPNRMLRERLSTLGIDVLDLLDPLREESLDQRLYKPRDTHWNIAGNALAADLIGEHLLAKGW